MSAYLSIGSNFSFGNITDALFSAAFTAACGTMALTGLNKINIVFGRGVNATLKGMGWDTTNAKSWPARIASIVPERVSNLFQDDVNYNEKVQSKDEKGLLFVDANKKVPMMEHKFSNRYLLASGLTLSLFALAALELKSAIWRETNPLLNAVLKQISPFQMVLGQSWISDGINAGLGIVKSRIA